MPSIFGFKHEPLCPCQLINIKDSERESLICSDCTKKFRLDCDRFLCPEKDKWTGNFEDFLGVFIEDRLMHLRFKHINSCKYNYTDREYISVIGKIDKMIENFISKEDERLDAKFELGEIAIEELAAI